MKYDTIIIGAGIAGSSLAYNLKKIRYKKNVLIIEKISPGSNSPHYHRIISNEMVNKYRLPFIRTYKGLKLGVHNQIYASIKYPSTLVSYSQVCSFLIEKSDAILTNESALSIEKNRIITDKNHYQFKYLIDCSGTGFFARDQLNLKKPFRFWVGKSRVISNKIDEMGLDTDYYYYTFDDSGYVEDIYPLQNSTLQGDWQYSKHKTTDVPVDKPNHFNMIEADTKEEHNSLIPCSPVFPMVRDNTGFLGDSCGNTRTSSAKGMDLNIKCSEIMASCIKDNDLKRYEAEWRNRYHKVFLNHLTSRVDRYLNPTILKTIKNYPKNKDVVPIFNKHPEVFINSFLDTNKPVELPDEIKNKIPKKQILFWIIHNTILRMRYALMR